MIRRPIATSFRIVSGGSDSRSATRCISRVIVPWRAKNICVRLVIRISLRRYEPDQVLRVRSQPRHVAGAPLSMSGIYPVLNFARAGRSVALRGLVRLVPLRPVGEGVQATRLIQREDAVEVIDFGLQQP